MAVILSIFREIIFFLDIPFTGDILLAVAFLLFGFSAFFSVGAGFCGQRSKRKIQKYCRGCVYAAGLICISDFLLFLSAFVVVDLRLLAAARYCSSNLSFFYRISSSWAGAEGSFFLWAVLVCAAFALWVRNSRNYKKLEQIALPVGSFVCLAFIFILKFITNPFAPSPETINQGAGLNPLLQNLWNVIHPPLLFVGYAFLVFPFIIGVAGSITGEINEIRTQKHLRKWIIAGLVFLTAGILTGARWSYYELGWGGYWAWDPVENASLLPWLMAITALHSIAGVKYSSGFRIWILITTAPAFILTLISTFITRSGILQSVHAFAASAISGSLLLFILLSAMLWVISLVLYLKKHTKAAYSVSSTAGKWQSDILFWANVIFIFTTAVIMTGTFFSPITKITGGQSIEITREFYDNFIAIIAILLSVLLILSAAISLYRKKRFVCGYSSIPSILIHLGFLLMVFSASMTHRENSYNLSLKKGEPAKAGNYTVVYEKFQRRQEGDITQIGTVINISGENFSGTFFPYKNLYPSGRQTSEVSVSSGLLRDIYLWYEGLNWNGTINIGIKIIPFMLWFWVSGGVIISGLICFLFKRK
jgi:cytochrome c biogenesis factor